MSARSEIPLKFGISPASEEYWPLKVNRPFDLQWIPDALGLPEIEICAEGERMPANHFREGIFILFDRVGSHNGKITEDAETIAPRGKIHKRKIWIQLKSGAMGAVQSGNAETGQCSRFPWASLACVGQIIPLIPDPKVVNGRRPQHIGSSLRRDSVP